MAAAGLPDWPDCIATRSLSEMVTGTEQSPVTLVPVMLQVAPVSPPFRVNVKVRVALPPGAADSLTTMRALVAAGTLLWTFAISVELLQVRARSLAL